MSPRHLIAISFLALLIACGDAPTSTSQDPAPQAATPTLDLDHPANYSRPSWPVHYDARVLLQDNTPDTNVITDRGATLGRVLFYDRRLSINDRVSCATCHVARQGFANDAKLSIGFDGVARTKAHAMRLANVRFYTPRMMFWDRRAPSLEAQAIQPIMDPVEMGFDPSHGGLDSLLGKVRALDYYPTLFAYAFGDPAISEARIQRALAQFVRGIVSLDSRFDQEFARAYDPMLANRGILKDFAGFTAQENRGKLLFILARASGGAGCGSCHEVPTFALTGSSRSIGLDEGETRVFKSPSLKNVAVTGPYMHDGRFATLAQVIEHYVNGIQEGPSLDERLRAPENGLPQRLPLTSADKAALVSFLKTLTDPTVMADPRFSDPFVP